MKELIFFSLLATVLCFCYCKKNRDGDYNAEVAETFEVLVDDERDIPIGAAYMSPRTPPLEPFVSDNRHHISVDDIRTVSVESHPKPLSDEEIEEAVATGARAVWITVMRDTVMSKLQRTFNSVGSDEIIAIVYTIIKTELDIIGDGLFFPQNLDDVDFYIEYKDDNYIIATFAGMIGGGHITHFNWPVMVDIKNKKRLILKDVVKINDRFVKTVFKELDETIRETFGGGDNYLYRIDELNDDLLEANVLYMGKHSPSVASYFDADNLVLFFSKIPSRAIILPLSKIRTMIILPDFPIKSE